MTSVELLFAYGTLQDEAVQLGTFGRRLVGAIDSLAGYRMGALTSGGEVYRVAEPTGRLGDTVEGVVYEISAGELKAADIYEAEDYRRVRVRLNSGLEAWLYVRA